MVNGEKTAIFTRIFASSVWIVNKASKVGINGSSEGPLLPLSFPFLPRLFSNSEHVRVFVHSMSRVKRGARGVFFWRLSIVQDGNTYVIYVIRNGDTLRLDPFALPRRYSDDKTLISSRSTRQICVRPASAFLAFISRLKRIRILREAASLMRFGGCCNLLGGRGGGEK